MTHSAVTTDSVRPRLSLSPVAVIVVCAVALSFLGITILFSASASFKQGPLFYVSKQLIGVGLAAVVGWVVSRVDLELAEV
jgi:cell division protein FtsW